MVFVSVWGINFGMSIWYMMPIFLAWSLVTLMVMLGMAKIFIALGIKPSIKGG